MDENDELHNPKPHLAPAKGVVSAVLSTAVNAGDLLITLLGGLLAAALILYSGYVLYDNFQIENQAFSSAWDVLQYKPELLEQDNGGVSLSQPAALTEINQDYRAWLTLYETNVDYPVVQGPNDVYYASHDIYGEFSLTGAIYLSAGNSVDMRDAYNLIYGHHMDNGAMFGSLDAYLDPAYLLSHREGVLVSSSGIFNLEAFAVINTDAYEKAVYETGPDRSAAEILAFLTDPDEQTTVRYFDQDTARGAEKIVALSTCANATTNGRLVVFFKATLRNLIIVEIPSYLGVYDANWHSETASVNYPGGTTVEYSTDGGKTWSTEPPAIRNVGTVEVLARATNEQYGVATASATLTVTPAPAVVTALNSSKTCGDPDPVFSAYVTGVFDGYPIRYTVSRVGGNEDVGYYPGVIVPSGPSLQGNYSVVYVLADFTITAGDTLSLAANGYEGIYDGVFHKPSAAASVSEGTTLHYSTDGGKTWSTEPPAIRDVGTVTVLIRADNPNYDSVTVQVTLWVKPRPATVTANDAEKLHGTKDPEFTATVTGLLGDDQLVYTVTRPSAGEKEEIGSYPDAIIAAGEVLQGNYSVSYYPGDFTILANGSPIVYPTDPTDPTGSTEATEPRGPATESERVQPPFLSPRGQSLSVWALVNLICVLLTAYLFLPLLHLRDKFGRVKLMKQVNEVDVQGLLERHPEEEPDEDDLSYRMKKFRRRLRVGVVLEALTTVIAVVVFLLTEDMRLPMVLIDRWTPLMLLILLIAWILDLRLSRYREEAPQEAEDAQQTPSWPQQP